MNSTKPLLRPYRGSPSPPYSSRPGSDSRERRRYRRMPLVLRFVRVMPATLLHQEPDGTFTKTGGMSYPGMTRYIATSSVPNSAPTTPAACSPGHDRRSDRRGHWGTGLPALCPRESKAIQRNSGVWGHWGRICPWRDMKRGKKERDFNNLAIPRAQAPMSPPPRKTLFQREFFSSLSKFPCPHLSPHGAAHRFA